MVAAGAIVLVAALVLVMRGAGGERSAADESRAAQKQSSMKSSGPSVRQQVKNPRKAQAPANSAAEAGLRRLLEQGDLTAVEEELSRLADSRQLAGVAELLRTWCREGELELAQWCLMFAGESDPELHLKLCAEALSNSSEVIREAAAAHLENASGIRFEDSARASAWLAGRPPAQ